MFFRKKNKNIENLETKEVVALERNVVIWEKVGNTDSFVSEFKVKRLFDEKDRTSYLINEKKRFFELEPQQERDFVKMSKDEIEKKLKSLREALKKEQQQDTEKINDKNLEFEILQLEAKLRYYKYDPATSYLRFGKGGVKQYEFLRDGNTLYPYKRDLDTATIYIPNDTKRKKAGVSRGNKINKYSKHKKILEGGAVFIFFAGLIMFCVGGYALIKTQSTYDDTNLAASQRASLDVANQCGEYIANTARSVELITKSLETNLNRPQTIIQGAEVK